MSSIFTSTKFFNQPIDHQSPSNDRLKPVMTTGLVNMHIGQSIANLVQALPPPQENHKLLYVSNTLMTKKEFSGSPSLMKFSRHARDNHQTYDIM